MNSQEVVLCGASAYEHKYYFNEDFSALPRVSRMRFRSCALCLRRMWAAC